jgi:glycerophosphoryl diester phosphodiesterase
MSLRDLLHAARSQRVLVEAHRSGCVEGVTSLDRFEHTWRSGADILELDVQFTADRVAVVHHDFTGFGDRLVSQVTSDALRVASPSAFLLLRDVLAWSHDHGGIPFAVDLKTGHGDQPWWVPELIALLRRFGLTAHVMLLCWDHRLLVQAAELEANVVTRALLRGRPTQLAEFLDQTPTDGISLSYDLINASDVECAHQRKMFVAVAEMWRPDFIRVVDSGADIVSADDPRAARAALQEVSHRARDALGRPRR